MNTIGLSHQGLVEVFVSLFLFKRPQGSAVLVVSARRRDGAGIAANILKAINHDTAPSSEVVKLPGSRPNSLIWHLQLACLTNTLSAATARPVLGSSHLRKPAGVAAKAVSGLSSSHEDQQWFSTSEGRSQSVRPCLAPHSGCCCLHTLTAPSYENIQGPETALGASSFALPSPGSL